MVFCRRTVEDGQSHPARNGLPSVKNRPHGFLRPPDLIIQDELHLISGPLGSMVGLYETAVDELCSWEVDGKKVRPKVVASTATIRRAPDQVQKLFVRKLEVFPPQGTSIRDSFFAIQRPTGAQYPGRRYLGICAFGRRYPVAMIRSYVAHMAVGAGALRQIRPPGRSVDDAGGLLQLDPRTGRHPPPGGRRHPRPFARCRPARPGQAP